MMYAAIFILPESKVSLKLPIDIPDGSYLLVDDDMIALGKKWGIQFSHLEEQEVKP